MMLISMFRGVDPLTPEDIGEVIVFTATRRENVVIADSLIFPNHQVSSRALQPRTETSLADGVCSRLALESCTEDLSRTMHQCIVCKSIYNSILVA